MPFRTTHSILFAKDMKRITTILFILLSACYAMAQLTEPAKFTITHKVVDDKEIVVTFKGKIEQGWHVYSTDVGSGGPTPATFNIDESKGLKPIGKLHPVGNVVKKFDRIFDMELSFFENTCTFEQRLAITGQEYALKCYLEYGACNDRNCTPPTSVEYEIPLTVISKAPEENEDKAATEEEKQEDVADADTKDSVTNIQPLTNTEESIDSALWSSKTAEIKALTEKAFPDMPFDGSGPKSNSLWWLFLMGFIGGLIAVLTPCVWPIIPMTVSFFLKRSSNKRSGLRDALLYGLSIIVIYMTLGVAVTLLFGANAANALSTNAVVNIFFCLMLIAFGLSFMGFFELELPSSWSNKADRKAEQTRGFVSIFIMAFTLALVSFSCTGPIIGFMLVEVSTTGNMMGPMICMLGFAIALALPFTLFAMFPTVLKRAPKSGSWMNTLKVVLGFVEVAFALKFLSVADMAYGWHLLSREAFLIIWILLALLLGLYLLGVLRLPIDNGSRPKRNIVKTVLALICLAFAAYMVPGILGKPLKAVSAFAPPMSMQHIHLYDEQVEAQFTDYETGMAYAKAHNKPVLIDFTGYGCVNCREMEMNVWNDPQVAKRLREDFVLISLFVDDKTSLPQRVKVEEYGRTTTLRTIGDKWSYLQRKRFGANVQPFYVLCSPDGEPLAPPYSYDTDVEKFLKFLDIK